MTFQIHLKSKISESELDEATDVCVRAYVGELASNSMVGGDESLKDPIFRAMIRAGELAGEVYFATDDDTQQVVGVAVWFPPGTSLFESEEQRALGFDEFMTKLSPETSAFWSNAYVPVVDKFLAEVLGADGTRNSQYLNQLATDPRFQRKGIATMLLKTVHNKAGISFFSERIGRLTKITIQFADSDTPPLFAHCAANEKNVCPFLTCHECGTQCNNF
ncbi:hypothetical protein B0H16DRAFT_1421514 [Mycena metata]|uniref:N-acetyltransferase domain-containing protein n=1 Tax=Mycena metata TaxID=1033252 RepID=A0AAD7IQC1_9AGAR|nr:hypothetical protein B0H16DRAFT_1421514 [Mycena metata]